MKIEDCVALTIVQVAALCEQHKAAGRFAAATDLYKLWIATHADDALLFAGHYNYGVALADADDSAGAVIAFRDCLRLNPDFHQARIALGLALEKLGQSGNAVIAWTEVAQAFPGITGANLALKISALENAGRVLESFEKDEAAENALRERLELARDDKVLQHWVGLRMRQCKWPALEPFETLTAAALLAGTSPLSLACLIDDPLFQLAHTHHYRKGAIEVPPSSSEPTRPARATHGGRLKIGYVSSDLREHAVGFSMAEIFELHDRRDFEVVAYYCGIERDDPLKARIAGTVDQWTDIRGMSDAEVAQKIRDDDIAILIDVNGYTKDARTAVFAMRPTPIAVNWFGFPSTMASDYHHYIIADQHVIPPGFERFYSETVVRLPCYQPNDRKRTVSARCVARSEEGLPDDAFVFCSFNGLQKLTAARFASWMTILDRVPDSVLWLLGGTLETRERLRTQANASGIAPTRLVFADKRPNPEHVARLALADLFVDNGPYGAHTTAADALWMGLPVLTYPGRSFASRVCASLVHAAGLSDFVCADADAYVAQAIELGHDRARLAQAAERLRGSRSACLLFDTPRLVEALEQAYREMWNDFQTGHLRAPDLSGLDAIFTFGLETDRASLECLSDAEYLAHCDDLARRFGRSPA